VTFGKHCDKSLFAEAFLVKESIQRGGADYYKTELAEGA